MIETVLLAVLIAKIKGYKLKPLFKTWTVFPSMTFNIFYIFLQISIFLGCYDFVKYAGLLEKLYILTFLPLILKYKLYKSAFVGSACVFIGTLLNKWAMSANGGKMPAFPTLSYITGYINADSFSKVKDIHIMGSSATKLKFLTDYIDIGYSILSIGDVFIRMFTFIIFFNAIKHSNKNYIE